MGLVAETRTVGALLGVEGNGSAAYFRVFGQMLRGTFHFTHRRRRPPTDPVNAMLSLGYTLLGHQVASAIQVVGLDPYSCQNYGQVSHELTFHASALSYARLLSNRLGGGLALRATHVTCETNDIRPTFAQ